MSSIGTKWTEEEETQLLSEINKNMKYKDIAIIHNRTINGISARVKHIAYQLYQKNNTIDEIMRITKLSKDQFDDAIKRRENKVREIKHAEKEPINTERPTRNNIMNEITTMKSDIAELKKDVKELLTLLHSIYEFEE
jgi:hypothetical protein